MSRKYIPLKRVAAIRVSNVDKKSADDQANVRLCNYTDVYYRDEIMPDQEFMEATASLEQIQNFRLKSGDTIITKDSETPDDIGVAAYVRESADDLICGYHLAIIRPTEDIFPKYLSWFMLSERAQEHFAVAATGVTRFGLRADSIATVPVPVLPRRQQESVANYLDAETTRIDRLVSAKKRQLHKWHERSGEAQALLARGLDIRSETKPTGLEWLPEIPINWRFERLKFVAKLESGHTPSRSRPELWTNANIPWVTLNDVGYLADHEYIENPVIASAMRGWHLHRQESFPRARWSCPATQPWVESAF